MSDVDVGDLRPVRDVSAGAQWIAPRLGPFDGRVGSVVPRGFEAYARILHAVLGPDQERTTWAAVCASTGRTAHPLMQWRKIAGVVDHTRRGTTTQTMQWDGGEPEEGNLDAASLAVLLRVLGEHTAPDAQCFFALWEGYGWIHGSPSVGTLGGREPIPPAFASAVMTGPRLHHPHRDYLLFDGALRAASTMGWWPSPTWFDPQSPNLFWPTETSWCVATEIDFDSTLVGGSRRLIEAVLADPALEAWPVNPGDSLAHDGNTVNRGAPA